METINLKHRNNTFLKKTIPDAKNADFLANMFVLWVIQNAPDQKSYAFACTKIMRIRKIKKTDVFKLRKHVFVIFEF